VLAVGNAKGIRKCNVWKIGSHKKKNKKKKDYDINMRSIILYHFLYGSEIPILSL